jgi:hypothetical protein
VSIFFVSCQTYLSINRASRSGDFNVTLSMVFFVIGCDSSPRKRYLLESPQILSS